ncbi:hypothetical protein DMB42_11800 [Nonomuraea sp. WAC 01424]|uniref:hypothetical protein n=1 Tax=Nonomuraea sp. WAC 01424 TaxID=2203200 RepID=UPI000F79924A|nr:hypothetical protein [Nonomuraea sp. WAC 01424]RSN12854.1 hypothetical protein DMB42_11800 [Nonomuraea sp. WAC 01424]
MKPSRLFFAAAYAFSTSVCATISALAVRDLIAEPFSWPTAAIAAGGAVATVMCASLLVRTLGDAFSHLFGWHRPAVEEMADPAYNPELDRHQRILRAALKGEAERYPADLHDVFGGGDD